MEDNFHLPVPNVIGRPPKYKASQSKEFAARVEGYFEWIQGEQEEVTKRRKEIDEHSGDEKTIEYQELVWTRKPEPPTVTGLTLFLGFSHKSSLYEYRDKKQFTDSVKKGLTMIEQFHEIATSYGDKCAGNIFILKNFGWKDKQEHEIKSSNVVVWKEEKTYEADEETNEGP